MELLVFHLYIAIPTDHSEAVITTNICMGQWEKGRITRRCTKSELKSRLCSKNLLL